MGPEVAVNYDNERKHFDQHGMLPVQYRIRALIISSRLQHDGLAKCYELDTDGESDEDGQFPGQEEHAVHITCNKENSIPR